MAIVLGRKPGGGGGGTPSGPAGGDLSGTYPNPTLNPEVNDPVQALFGTPSGSSFEFDTSSLVGLTAFSPTPDVENADTTVPSHYYVMDNAAGLAVCGRYLAPPATPYTAITLVTDANSAGGTSPAAYLTLGVTTPGAFDAFGIDATNSNLRGERYTSPTVFGSNFFNASLGIFFPPVWLACRVNSSTNVDYLYSRNGYIWREFVNARNPGITIDSVGIGMKSEGAAGFAVVYGFLRIWTSALVFPGVP